MLYAVPHLRNNYIYIIFKNGKRTKMTHLIPKKLVENNPIPTTISDIENVQDPVPDNYFFIGQHKIRLFINDRAETVDETRK